jgi:hypothetical protein
VNWFKLVGATDSPVDENWEHTEPGNFTVIHFPWNKPPTKVCSPDRIILYAVGGRLMATQTVDGPPRIEPRRGPAGSPENRWPHSIQVRTHRFCSPLSSAPELRKVAPDFAEHHSKRFRDGSHWQISDAEYEQLAATIDEVGRPYSNSG